MQHFKCLQCTLIGLVTMVAIWMSLVNRSTQFLLENDQCLAYPPCTCSGSSVHCESKDLTTFPRFRVANVSFYNMIIGLENNNLTTIPSDSFKNLTMPYTTIFSFTLSGNNLNSIATYAFNGIADIVNFIDLDDNNFTAIPSALGKLTNLKHLYFRGNPIVTLSTSAPVLQALSRTLITLYLDLKYIQAWPIELSYLHALTTLYLTKVQQHFLDYDAFDGFTKTLQRLHITNSKFEKIPFSICHLENLRDLYFSNNTNIRINSSVLESCAIPLTHVRMVILNGDNLRYTPDVIETFPSMRTLYMNGNQLAYIDSDTIPSNTSVGFLSLDRNNFTRIPTAVNKLSSLRTLSMIDNHIVSVEGSDLKDLINLTYLYLDNNPIEYISSQTFTTNKALVRLSLSNTKLRILPASLTGLNKLETLYLGSNPTECTCKLSYLRAWNLNNTDIQGTCDQSLLLVKTYIKEDLPKCP